MVDIVPMVMCKTNEFWQKQVVGSKGSVYTVTFDALSHKRHDVVCDFSCTCQAYKFGKKYCKHIEAVKGDRCGWHQQFDGGEAINGKCPQCGGEIVGIVVGV